VAVGSLIVFLVSESEDSALSYLQAAGTVFVPVSDAMCYRMQGNAFTPPPIYYSRCPSPQNS